MSASNEVEKWKTIRENQNQFGETVANNRTSPNTFFRIENWYPVIREFTPAIEIVPLDRSEAKALTRYKEVSKMLLVYNDLQRQEIDPNAPVGNWSTQHVNQIDAQMLEHMGESDFQKLTSIRQKLDTLIEKFDRKAFVKLSTRSPKGIYIFFM